MQPYGNSDRDTGVSHFQLGKDSITLEFRDGSKYQYSNVQPGKKHVEAMKKLALAGEGLTTYVNKYVRENYARKI